MKVYISGPMTGYQSYNFPLFYEAEAELLSRPDVENVFNPAAYDAAKAGVSDLTPEEQGAHLLENPHKFDLLHAQHMDIEIISRHADAILLLPGWSDSCGARAEAHLALWLGRTVLLYHPGQEHTLWELSQEEAKAFIMGGTPPVFIQFGDPLDEANAEHGALTGQVPVSGNCCGSGDFCPNYEETVVEVPLEPSDPAYWARERQDVLDRFAEELSHATGDGSKKRQAGEKPPWYWDTSHEGAIFSHLTKWKRGEQVDPDSGAHPLVHAAWRCLAIACSENANNPAGIDTRTKEA